MKNILFIGFIIFSFRALSSTEKTTGSLRIGTMDLRPYGWEDEHGKKHGIIYEMNSEIAKRMNVSFTNRIYPFKRMLKLLKDGELDIVSSQAHDDSTKAGEKLAVQFDINVIAGTKKGSNISRISDFKDKQLIYHSSASYKELKGLPKNIIRVNSYLQSLAILAKMSHSDGAVFSEPAYYYWMKFKGLTPKDFGNVVMIQPNKKQWVFVRKGLSIKLRKRIKNIVDEIYKENYYSKLLYKYGKQ